MNCPRTRGSTRAQRGVALLALMVLVVLGVAWFVVSGLESAANRTASNRVNNAEVLAEAKAALIGWMIVNASKPDERNPGRLPCPEGAAQSGIAAGACDDSPFKKIGRLPWRTLGLPKPLDATGEPLWYVVSPDWALPSTSATLMINSDSMGRLTVDNQANSAVALIVAPGAPLITEGSTACPPRPQNRSMASLDPCDYLESALSLAYNPAATPPVYPEFATTGTAGMFNDQILVITRADLIPPLEAAIAARLQRDLSPVVSAAAARLRSDLAPAPLRSAAGIAVTGPVFPFANAWTNPATAAYTGTTSPPTSGGLVPLVRSRKSCSIDSSSPIYHPGCDLTLSSVGCTPGVDAQCDPASAVTWPVDPSNPSVEVTKSPKREWTVTWSNGYQAVLAVAPEYPGSVRIGDVDRCGAGFSSRFQISCRVTYGQKCGGGCGATDIDLVVTARTSTTAGKAFRRANPVLLGSTYNAGHSANSVAMQSDGSAVVTTVWRLPQIPASCGDDDCLTTRITVPALYIEDNVIFQSTLRDAPSTHSELRWFVNSRWHQLSYFAISPAQVWGRGATPCAGTDCLSVSIDGTASTQQALLLLAGRALAGRTRPSAALSDYFEGLNAVEDGSFEARTVNSTFNDRVVLIPPGP